MCFLVECMSTKMSCWRKSAAIRTPGCMTPKCCSAMSMPPWPLCAVNTKKIKLGPGVTNPASRIAPVTACSIASINELAPGRTILGIGTGNTARRTLGMPAARLIDMREHIETCRDLLSGKTTPYQEGHRRRMVKFLNPKGGWINIRKKVPIYVAASGPKTLELAGEIADGDYSVWRRQPQPD